MVFSELIRDVQALRIIGGTDQDIKALVFDSRQAVPGVCFVATRGTAVDGHRFVPDVIRAGASAVVVEELPAELCAGVTYVLVGDSREALGRMASNWFGRPSERMQVVAVTGTNGKTSIATLLYQMFRKLGHRVGLLSTVVNYVDCEAVEATHTTPDPMEMNALMRRMADAGCDYLFMEASSHAIDQRRIAGIRLAGAIFTNLTRDHMDYHKTVENYLRAKKRLFDDLGREAFAVTNLDDRNGEVMLQNCRARHVSYALKCPADHKGMILEESFDGMLMQVDGVEAFMPFVGRFNAQNVMAVYAAARELGVSRDEALRLLSSLSAAPGRFETFRSASGVTAIVDYAHTPDALENVIRTVNEIKRGRLITVCGCGGNRDRGKRPMMARAAAAGSELVVLTSDNPRDEDPAAIIDEMLTGVEPADMDRVFRQDDRREAIRMALTVLARPDDVVLIAGKGHEDYQIIKGVKHHFDDREIVRQFFGL